MTQRMKRFWRSYKYRFVPWIAANLKSRSARFVEASKDSIVPDLDVTASLVKLFTALDENEKLPPPTQDCEDCQNSHSKMVNGNVIYEDKFKYSCLISIEELFLYMTNTDAQYNLCPVMREKSANVSLKKGSLHTGKNSHLCLNRTYHCTSRTSTSGKYVLQSTCSKCQPALATMACHILPRQFQRLYSVTDQPDIFPRVEVEQRSKMGHGRCRSHPIDVMFNVFNFDIERKPSHLPGGGTGVFVGRGLIPKHHIVAMYPGTVYLPSEPILVQSLGNPFIFRCSDGVLVDGHDKRISRMIYNSCSKRDRLGPTIASSDVTWTTNHLQNPLSIGQYVNNHSKDLAANVAYQEYDVDHHFPVHLRKYLPNAFYTAGLLHQRPLRTVVLVSLRDIKPGEEVLSSYFTLIQR